MWEADFDAVDEAISDGFEEDKRFVVLWIEDDLLEFALEMVLSIRTRRALDMHVYLESLEVVHLWSALSACGLIFLCELIRAFKQDNPQLLQVTSGIVNVETDMGMPGRSIAAIVCMCTLPYA
jgi:hypothetical protein